MPSNITPNETKAKQDNLESCVDFDDADVVAVRSLAASLRLRGAKVLSEMAEFETFLKLKKRSADTRGFKSAIQAEMKVLDRILEADTSSHKTSHCLVSSNMVFYCTVWRIAKAQPSVVALSKRLWKAFPVKDRKKLPGSHRNVWETVVHIIAQGGLEWIKVSSVAEKRLIWDLAKAGWVGSDSDEDGDEIRSLHEDDSEGLLKQVETLLKAAKDTKTTYRSPTVKLILTRIKAEPDSKEVSNLLQRIRELGVVVETSDEFSQDVSLGEVLGQMTAEPFETLSETLNLDCSILLALISDISHGNVESSHWHNEQIPRQMELERNDPFLPNRLWPTCASRKLVCTREAAVKFDEIVGPIATETERKRARLLFNMDCLPKEDIIPKLQELSSYVVPPTWNLPVEIIDVDLTTIVSKCPKGAQGVYDVLSPLNRSIFFFGWANDLTTITSNRTATREINSAIKANQSDEELRGPNLWVTASSRSLVGQEKKRRGK